MTGRTRESLLLITPETIRFMVGYGVQQEKADEAQGVAGLVVESLRPHLRAFAEDGIEHGPLTLETSPGTIELYCKTAMRHGELLAAIFPPFCKLVGEGKSSFENPFALVLIRKILSTWRFSPNEEYRRKEPRGQHRMFYHLLMSEEPNIYVALIQRQGESDVSVAHAHWSVESYTPMVEGTRLWVGNEWREVEPLQTVVVPPGQVHQIKHEGPIMSLTFLEIIGSPAPVKLTDENRCLLDGRGTFSKEDWIAQARLQGVIN